MTTLNYSIEIKQSIDRVFNTIMDQSTYADWAKAWGPGMKFSGEWQEGGYISFFDENQGGTKAIIEEFIPNEYIRMKHMAMVDPANNELEPSDEMMRKWIGTLEIYKFKELGKTNTQMEVELFVDEAFEPMMNAWTQALEYFKEICED